MVVGAIEAVVPRDWGEEGMKGAATALKQPRFAADKGWVSFSAAIARTSSDVVNSNLEVWPSDFT